ncbi:hypothetical protein HOD29_07095 [archaeon]|jgi:argininosuccinate synthase|nr:hypothetical protein [archaeon]
MNIDKENLEKALDSGQGEEPKTPEMPKDVEIGFHQGALSTLNGERHAFVELIQHVEARMQAHIKRLEQLGVKFQQPEEKKE